METRLDHVMPPRGHEIEIRTLSALIHLGDPKNIRVQAAMLKLEDDCFMQMDHRVIFKLIQQLFAKGNPFDFVEFIGLVPTELYNFVNLSVTDHYMFANHLEHDVDKLLAFRSLRRQLRVLVNAVNRAMEQPLPEDGIAAIREELQGLSNSDHSQFASIVRSYEVEIDEMLCESDNEQVDFPVNIPDLPNVPNRSLITIAGRSGHGKTFFALYLMDAIIDAHQDRQTLYFNLEMHPRVMIERHAILLGARGANRKELIGGAAHLLLPKNVSLVSVPMITIEQIESECRIAALKQPICCIVVDYLSLVGSKAKYEAKYIQQNDIAKRLAALSLELDCVVLGLIQVNREFKNRPIGDRCPLTSDAAESSGSVHSSSWWIGIDQPQNDDNSGEYQNLFQVACRKNRGDSGLFTLNLNFQNGRFSKYFRPFCPKPIDRDGF